MDLFDYMREKNAEKESPLASRLRPRTLDEVVGQRHILGEGKLLRRGRFFIYSNYTVCSALLMMSSCMVSLISTKYAEKPAIRTTRLW